MELKVGGIYCLPNGRELIVLCNQDGQVSLCGGCQYEINADGRLICNGKLTAWDSSNLIDTGRNVGVEELALPGLTGSL